MLYFRPTWCYMYSFIKTRVNEKRPSTLPGQTGRRGTRDKICPHSISSSRNRNGAEFRPPTERNLGSAAKGRATDKLPQFSQDSIAQQKNRETNQRLGETG